MSVEVCKRVCFSSDTEIDENEISPYETWGKTHHRLKTNITNESGSERDKITGYRHNNDDEANETRRDFWQLELAGFADPIPRRYLRKVNDGEGPLRTLLTYSKTRGRLRRIPISDRRSPLFASTLSSLSRLRVSLCFAVSRASSDNSFRSVFTLPGATAKSRGVPRQISSCSLADWASLSSFLSSSGFFIFCKKQVNFPDFLTRSSMRDMTVFGNGPVIRY